MGLRRIYVDNLIYKGVPGKINLNFPENKCIYTRTGSIYDLDDIFRELIPDLLVDDVRFNFINDEEIATIIIETDEGTYSRAVDPEGNIVFENLSSSSTTEKEEKSEVLNLMKIREFCKNVTSYTLALTDILLPQFFLEEGPIKLFNSVIPLVFSEVSEVLNNGSAVIKGQIFSRDDMGGGYTQMLRILYAVWAAKTFKTHTIYLNYWYNHLHVLVRKWLWNEFFPKLDDIEGTLIIDNPEI